MDKMTLEKAYINFERTHEEIKYKEAELDELRSTERYWRDKISELS